MKQSWKRVEDDRILHIWKRGCNEECDEDETCESEITVTPDWYQENGTPICPACGEDMVYSHTEVLI